MSAILEVRNLTKLYGETRAVDGVTLSVEEGSLFGLLGPNGSGKSTMIKMLTGQVRPTAGSVRVLGIDVEKDPVGVRSRVGIIPEQETPPSFLTSEEYLDLVGKVRAIPEIEEQKAGWFEYLEFEDTRDVLCKDLSRGTRQKLMFAQAFLHRPVLALIDEPLVNFDPLMQEKVKDYLRAYVKKGNTVFISTHILEIAEEICSDFAVLHTGRLLATGEIAEVTGRGRHLGEYFLSLVRRGSHA